MWLHFTVAAWKSNACAGRSIPCAGYNGQRWSSYNTHNSRISCYSMYSFDCSRNSASHEITCLRCSSQVQWLIENYETAEGVSLPRSTLYNHYLRHCQEQKIDPMNPASFGKLIRSVFLGLRTRRLGTRYDLFLSFPSKNS